MPDIFGNINNPLEAAGSGYRGLLTDGPVQLLNNILRLIIVAAGLFALFNFIMAGFQYMSAGDDPKAMNRAWSKIWQSLVGLIIIVGSFAIAGLVGYLLFGRVDAILNPKIYGSFNN